MDEIAEKIEAQRKFQEDSNSPDFAPNDGICFSCHGQIYEAFSLEQASTGLITFCPFCNYSFCD